MMKPPMATLSPVCTAHPSREVNGLGRGGLAEGVGVAVAGGVGVRCDCWSRCWRWVGVGGGGVGLGVGVGVGGVGVGVGVGGGGVRVEVGVGVGVAGWSSFVIVPVPIRSGNGRVDGITEADREDLIRLHEIVAVHNHRNVRVDWMGSKFRVPELV